MKTNYQINDKAIVKAKGYNMTGHVGKVVKVSSVLVYLQFDGSPHKCPFTEDQIKRVKSDKSKYQDEYADGLDFTYKRIKKDRR